MRVLSILLFIFTLPSLCFAERLVISFGGTKKDAGLTAYTIQDGVLSKPFKVPFNKEVIIDIPGQVKGIPLAETIRRWENSAPQGVAGLNPSYSFPSRQNGSTLLIPILIDGKQVLVDATQSIKKEQYAIRDILPDSQKLVATANASRAEKTQTEGRLPGQGAGQSYPCPNCGQVQDRPVLDPKATKGIEDVIAQSTSNRGTRTPQAPKATQPAAAAAEKYLPIDEKYPTSCQNFIKPDGTLGPFGQAMVQEMNRPEYGGIFENHSMLSYTCPNFYDFSKTKKQNYIVTYMMHLSYIESMCGNLLHSDPSINPNGSGKGLFQFEADWHSVLAARNKMAEEVFGITNTCPRPIVNHSNNIRCAVANMAMQLKGRFVSASYNGGVTPQSLISNATYWGPIKRNDLKCAGSPCPAEFGASARIHSIARNFPGCGTPTPAKGRGKGK